MKQINCTDAEFAVAQLVIAAMRSDEPVMVEYEGADNAVYVYRRGDHGPNLDPLCLTRPDLNRINSVRQTIEATAGGSNHA